MNIINKISGTIQKILRNNFISDRRYKKLRARYLNFEFLNSPKYEDLFKTYFEGDIQFENFLNDAQEEGKNYRFRHGQLAPALGSWRWKGVYQKRAKLLPVIFDNSLKGIDLGGAYGPISTNTTIVDSR